MATILKNILDFTGLTVGVPVSLPHQLNVNGIPVAPKIGGANAEGFAIAADATNVTVTRTVNAGSDAVQVYVEYWHTIESVTPLLPPPGKLIGLTPFFFASGGASGPEVNVQEEGVDLPANPHATLNFIGDGVTATDAGGGVAQIEIPGVVTVEDQSAPIANNPHRVLNFLGGGVTTVDAGGGVANITITGEAGPQINVQDEGVAIPNNPHTTLNFVGNGVTATDAGAGVAQIQIPAFAPERTLFVSPVWPSGVDPLVFFTTISAALTQAATLTPTATAQVLIVIYPGTYPQNLNLISWVTLRGAGAFPNVVISGTVTWAPTAAVQESMFLYFLRTNGLITVNTTGKVGGQTSMIFNNCFLSASLTYTGRSAVPGGPTRDLLQLFNCIPGMTPYTVTTAEVELQACRLSSMTFNGACRFDIAGGATIPAAVTTWLVNGTSSGVVTGAQLLTPWTLASGTAVVMSGCDIIGLLTVAAGAAADVRGSNYNGNANLAGLGTINRTVHMQSFGPTAIGANPVVFAVPFPDGAYNVALQLTAGPGNPAVTVTPKAGAGFTINDAVGGNTYDIIVTHD